MIELERGPLERLADEALQRLPAAPSFEGLVASALEGAGGVDAALGGVKVDVAGEGVPDLDGAYVTTVGVSEATLANQIGAEDDGRATELGDRTEGAEAYRRATSPYLPQPDAPIEGDFNEPPPPAPTGGGGDEGGDEDRNRE